MAVFMSATEATYTRAGKSYSNRPVNVETITSFGRKTGHDGQFELHFSGNPTTWVYAVEANRDSDYNTLLNWTS